ncbi:MAG: acyltransferase [Tatlockia sp.]|nr:acyltransferase [Tatlockia sp.]
MQKSSQPVSPNFSIEIESLRGIAAFLVLLGHLYLFGNLTVFLPSNTSEFFKVLVSGFFNPQPSVLLFFTISGLVLGRQLRKNPVENFRTFIAYLCRRGFRLLPLIWVTTIFAFTLDGFVHHRSFSLLLSNLMLKDISLNLVLWSIHVELWCSIFFPILFWMFKNSGIFFNALLFIGCVLMSLLVQKPLFMQFWIFFHAGLLIDVLSANTSSTRFKNPLLLVFGYLLFILAPEFCFGTRIWLYGHWQNWILPEIIACPLILFFIVHNKNTVFNAFLHLSWIRYLGKISFSIYLIHFPILLLMLNKFPIGSLSQLVIFSILFITATILISDLAYRWIEVPFNNLGRKYYKMLTTDLPTETVLA